MWLRCVGCCAKYGRKNIWSSRCFGVFAGSLKLHIARAPAAHRQTVWVNYGSLVLTCSIPKNLCPPIGAQADSGWRKTRLPGTMPGRWQQQKSGRKWTSFSACCSNVYYMGMILVTNSFNSIHVSPSRICLRVSVILTNFPVWKNLLRAFESKIFRLVLSH